MSEKEAKKLKRLIARYAEAAVDYSWRGRQDGKDIPAIEEDFEKSRKALLHYIAGITTQTFPQASRTNESH